MPAYMILFLFAAARNLIIITYYIQLVITKDFTSDKTKRILLSRLKVISWLLINIKKF